MRKAWPKCLEGSTCRSLGAQHVRVLEGTRSSWCTNGGTRFMKTVNRRGARYMYVCSQWECFAYEVWIRGMSLTVRVDIDAHLSQARAYILWLAPYP